MPNPGNALDAVEGEGPRGVDKGLVSISARAVAAKASSIVIAANSSVETPPLGDGYDVVVAELAEDPLGAGEAPTSRVVGGGARYRVQSGNGKSRWNEGLASVVSSAFPEHTLHAVASRNAQKFWKSENVVRIESREIDYSPYLNS